MSAAAQYAYLHGRVSIFGTRLLQPDQLDKLIQLPPEQEDELYQTAGFARPVGEDPEQLRSSLEQRLIALLLADVVILARPLIGRARDFLVYWAYRFELSNLKVILRGKLSGQNAAVIRAQLVDLGSYGRLPTEELLRTDDVAELLRRLDGTPYADVARQARRVYEERHELFALDAAIDRQYFAGLAKRAHEAGGDASGALRGLVGNMIDRLNLLWLLRYRFAYGLAPSEAYYLLIPATHRLDGRTLLALSQLNSFDEVITRLPPPWAEQLAGAATTVEVMHRLERESWRLAEAVLHRSVFNLARVFAYLVLRERDLRQMRAIIRGRRIGLPTEAIREAVGHVPAH
ncbi:MAG TPA: V-type ATPase subunit [Acidiferrobacterales bacterium]